MSGFINVASQAGLEGPSGAVWAGFQTDSVLSAVNGRTAFRLVNYDGAPLPGFLSDSDTGSTFTQNDGTFFNRSMDMSVTNTDNNASAIFTAPLAPATCLLAMEAEITPDGLGNEGWFVGFAEGAALSRDVVADNPSTSGQAGLIGESLIGFVTSQTASSIDQVDAVIRKDNGTVETVLADVTNASALDVRTGASGQIIRKDLRGDLDQTTRRNYGVVVNPGLQQIEWYVDGVKVAARALDSGVDRAKDMGAILGVKTGAAAAQTLHVGFFGAGARR